MRIICDSNLLSKICQNVQRAVSTKLTKIPALEGLLIKTVDGGVSVTGYDMEMGTQIIVRAVVEECGEIVLNARHLCDILRMLPDNKVTIECNSKQVCKITSGEAEYSLVVYDASEYPELPTVSADHSVKINKAILKDMIKKTIFAVATNVNDAVHTGIKFEISAKEITLAAVDGFRLAVRREAIDYNGDAVSFVVPAKTLNEIVKLSGDTDGDFEVSVGERHICFTVNGFTVISRLLDGAFIDYRSVIPKTAKTTAKVDVKNLVDCIERTSLIITDKSKSPLKCTISANEVKLSSATAIGTATDRMAATVNGDGLDIGFNNRYALDALKACDADEVRLEFNGATAPILIRPLDGESFVYLVLPVRLKN